MTKEFRLHRLASNEGERYTNSRGTYLARIRGNRDEQREKIRNMCRQIKQRLLRDETANISKAHVVAALVLYYGDEEDAPQAAAGVEEDIPQTAASDPHLDTPTDSGYGTQNMPYTPEPTPEP